MKKKLIIFLMLFLFLSTFVYAEPAMNTSAKGAVVMDVKSGRVLYSKDMSKKLEMASTTKIMTALLAVESGKLDNIVTIKESSCNIEGSSIYLKPGEKMTLKELIYGLMLRSGNDAAVAIADYVGGSINGFVGMMNNKAKVLGANNTHFVNPNGLPDSNHYTTAYDLALITSYAMKNSVFYQIVSSKQATIPGPPDENWDRKLQNKNKMLWDFQGADGVKTGYTKNAGRCLVSSATRDNMNLVCVVLNCGPMWEESSALLEYCYNNFSYSKIVDNTKFKNLVSVTKGKNKDVSTKPLNNLIIPIQEKEKEKIKLKVVTSDKHVAPIIQGAKAGELLLYIEDELVGKTPLIYEADVKSSSVLYNFKMILKEIN